jgi:hypothetical protein
MICAHQFVCITGEGKGGCLGCLRPVTVAVKQVRDTRFHSAIKMSVQVWVTKEEGRES